MFDLELHEDDRSGQDNQACCESDDDIIEIDDVSAASETVTLYDIIYDFQPHIRILLAPGNGPAVPQASNAHSEGHLCRPAANDIDTDIFRG